MSKLITFVGYSRVGSELKFRTATDAKRIGQLEKLGDTDVNITALPMAMTKSEAAKWALTAEFFTKNKEAGADVEALFVANVKDENPFAKTVKPVKVAKVAKAVKAKTVKHTVTKSQPGVTVKKSTSMPAVPADPIEFAKLWFAKQSTNSTFHA